MFQRDDEKRTFNDKSAFKESAAKGSEQGWTVFGQDKKVEPIPAPSRHVFEYPNKSAGPSAESKLNSLSSANDSRKESPGLIAGLRNASSKGKRDFDKKLDDREKEPIRTEKSSQLDEMYEDGESEYTIIPVTEIKPV